MVNITLKDGSMCLLAINCYGLIAISGYGFSLTNEFNLTDYFMLKE